MPSRSRPFNSLLRCISDGDFGLLAPYLDKADLREGQVLYSPGDQVEMIHFPCGPSLVSFVVVMEDGREIDAVQIGSDGAVGGIVSRARLPAYNRIVVRLAGRFIRLPIAKLETAKRKSSTLMDAFARYADCLFAQTVQSVACNAAHSIEERAAKWIVAIMERTGHDLVPLTHDQLANMLGVGRSYASRVIETFKAEGILETGRGSFLVSDPAALRQKSCLCDATVGQHFEELLGRVYLAPRASSNRS